MRCVREIDPLLQPRVKAAIAAMDESLIGPDIKFTIFSTSFIHHLEQMYKFAA